MFECSICSIWSHTDCVLGASVSDEQIEELEQVYCATCQAKVRRDRMQELRQLNITVTANGDITFENINNMNNNNSSEGNVEIPTVIEEEEVPEIMSDRDENE